MIRFSLKLGIAAGVTYFTVDQGVWRDSDKTVEIYQNIVQSVLPYVKEVNDQSPVKLETIPTPSDIASLVPVYWNKGVNRTCLFIGDLPSKTAYVAETGYAHLVGNPEVQKLLDSFSSSQEKPSDK